MEAKKLPKYEMPQVLTYTDEQILEELGPAQAQGYFNPCPGQGPGTGPGPCYRDGPRFP